MRWVLEFLVSLLIASVIVFFGCWAVVSATVWVLQV